MERSSVIRSYSGSTPTPLYIVLYRNNGLCMQNIMFGRPNWPIIEQIDGI